MELDHVGAGLAGIFSFGRSQQQIVAAEFGGGRRLPLIFGRHLDGNVGGVECGDGVLLGILGIRLVLLPVDKMQVDVLRALADGHSLASHDNPGIGRVGDVGQKDVAPDGRARGSGGVLHIEHNVSEALVEDARLHFKGNLGGFEFVLEAVEGSGGTRRPVNVIDQSQTPSSQYKDGDDADEGGHTDAAGAHGSDFTVRSQAAEPDEDAHQHPHGNGNGEGGGDGEKEQLGHAGQRGAGAHHQFQNSLQVAQEDDKGKDRRADQSVGEYFPQNVARENSHSALRRTCKSL
jgi:hypothetical protein